MLAHTHADQTIQEWGNSLAVRLSARVAKEARLSSGTHVRVEVVPEGVLLRPVAVPRPTLAQKLKAFDPAIHGGEAMASGRVGQETF